MASRRPASLGSLDQPTWNRLEESVAQLEAAWQIGQPTELGAFMPPVDDPVRSRFLVALIAVDQELRWEKHDCRLLESYLDEWPELVNNEAALVELLTAECLTRAAFADTPTSDELCARFPEVGRNVDVARVSCEATIESNCPEGRIGTGNGGADAAGPAEQRNGSRSVSFWSSFPRQRLLPLGTGVARYRITACVGYGAMGAVYRAFDPLLSRTVALKIPHTQIVADESLRQRFLNEAKSAAAIVHAHVCRVYDAGYTDGMAYLAMEFIEGQTLTEWLRDYTLLPRDAAELTRKLAEALQAVHSAGLLHRDVKPSNVLMDAASEPHLTDFGLAKSHDELDELTGTGTLLGTPAYMSPEQIDSDGEAVDVRSDVYSLGVVLYQLLTGRLPYTGSPLRVLRRIGREPPPDPRNLRPELDPALECLCLTAITANPAERFQSAGEFATALSAYVETGHPPRRLRWRRSARRLVRNRAALLFLAAVLAVAGLAVRLADLTLRSDDPATDAAVVFELYDYFHGSALNPELWSVIGTEAVHDVHDGKLWLWIIRNGEPQRWTVRSQPQHNRRLVRVRVDSDRSSGLTLPGQTQASIALTNDRDTIAVHWNNERNTLSVHTAGRYGERHPAIEWDPDDPGPNEIPDGPIVIEERSGAIRVLHNHEVVWELPGHTFSSDSRFEAKASVRADQPPDPSLRNYALILNTIALGYVEYRQLRPPGSHL